VYFSLTYWGADKSLAWPGRKQTRKHIRDARDFNNIETRAVIKFLFLQDKAPKEIHAILTETLSRFLPAQAKELSAPLYSYSVSYSEYWYCIQGNWYLSYYRGADKSLARPGRKQTRKHVRDARDFNNNVSCHQVLFSTASHCRLTSPTGKWLFTDAQWGLLWLAAGLRQGHATGSRDIQNGPILSGQPT